jgi:predicted amidohydrolase YtcJ
MEPGQAAIVIRDAEVAGIGRIDARVHGDIITALGNGLVQRGDIVVAGEGAALLPGLHDHHLHLLASAAAAVSVPCGPPDVTDAAGLAVQLAAAEPVDGWVRGVSYHESVAGDLDRVALDRLAPAVPTRVQHRSGVVWIVNSLGVDALGLGDAQVDGVERDAAGRPSGRLWRLDGWLRDKLMPRRTPDLRVISEQLAASGVTGVTDASPDLDAHTVAAIASAGLIQRVVLLGTNDPPPGTTAGPRKIVVSDHDLPSFDALAEKIRMARPRPVALHCVTAASLVLTLAVLTEVGTVSGDRVEHAAVARPELADWLARLDITVVTQPSLIARRGDDYLRDVEPADLAGLWPFASLLRAGVRVGCSSDAPYGELSPWISISAASRREAPSGRVVGAQERVAAWTALRGYLTRPDDPGGVERQVRLGAAADLALLDRPLAAALREPEAVTVRTTLVGGRIVHDRTGAVGSPC